MNMEAATGFARGNLRSEGYVVALLEGHVADNPFSYDELISCIDNINGGGILSRFARR